MTLMSCQERRSGSTHESCLYRDGTLVANDLVHCARKGVQFKEQLAVECRSMKTIAFASALCFNKPWL